MSNDSYTVFIKGKKVYSNLNVYEYMDIMEESVVRVLSDRFSTTFRY